MKPAIGFPISCGSFIGSKAPKYFFKKPTITKDKFVITGIPVERIISFGSSGILTDKDIQIYSYTAASSATDYIINIQYLSQENFPITFQTTNSSIIKSPSNSVASGVSTGSAKIIAYGPDESFSLLDVNVNQQNSITTNSFYGYLNNTAGKHCTDAISTRIAGKNPSTSKTIFNVQDHASSTYQRNTNCWCADLDLTPLSPWNSRGANTRAGTLISPRHIYFAAHYPLEIGDTIRFVTSNNVVITRTITNKLIHPGYNGYGCDIGIGLLDSDVPNTIGFVKILPSNWSSYIPSMFTMQPYVKTIPVFYSNQQEKALVYDWYYYSSSGTAIVGFRTPSDATRLSFNESVVVGDSGNPIILIINGQLVILTVFTTSGSGAFITYYKNDVNAMMTQLGGGYQLTEVDLSSFNSY